MGIKGLGSKFIIFEKLRIIGLGLEFRIFNDMKNYRLSFRVQNI